jgi:predicted  nucleic acid-binding Zn-ribbon protein
MKDELLRLLKVQDVEAELRALEDAKSKYPDEISERKATVAQAESRLTELSEGLEELDKQQRHHTREIETAKELLKKQEGRFAEVTTNKEYDALQMEIEACKNRISESESQILQILETTEEMKEQAEIETQEVDEIRQAEQGRIEELQTKLDSLQSEVDGVISRRKTALKGIDPELISVYERGGNIKGIKITAVRKGSCGVCYRQLPAQQKSNTRRNDQIIHCESCGSILVWDDESA